MPILVFSRYITNKIPTQIYSTGNSTFILNEDNKDTEAIKKVARYAKDSYNNSNEFYRNLVKKDVMKGASPEIIECVKKLGNFEENQQEDADFYATYIQYFFGDYIEEQSKRLFEDKHASAVNNYKNTTDELFTEKEEYNKEPSLTEPYIAMMLESSKYKAETLPSYIKNMNQALQKEKISSKELFDLGSILIYLETEKNKMNSSELFITLGNEWMCCYQEEGKVSEEMRKVFASLQESTKKQEFDYEER